METDDNTTAHQDSLPDLTFDGDFEDEVDSAQVRGPGPGAPQGEITAERGHGGGHGEGCSVRHGGRHAAALVQGWGAWLRPRTW